MVLTKGNIIFKVEPIWDNCMRLFSLNGTAKTLTFVPSSMFVKSRNAGFIGAVYGKQNLIVL